MKMNKIPTVNQLIKKLDRAFSLFIRLRDSDENGSCTCITCGKTAFWKEMQCGHYIGRRHMQTRYEELNTAAQCPWCNGFMEGRHFIFRQRLAERHGEEAVKRIEALAQIPGGLNRELLNYLILTYQAKVKKLKKEKGL
ncbi:MAG: recombination protein NinG [Treponema sp.]|jgi:hypothetical protein|nr:recombination protein NinG [Treponema sp.]